LLGAQRQHRSGAGEVGWYYGGTSVVDFTNPTQPQEVAFYDFTPTSGQSWSSYWYNGRIYSNDMNRGVDALA
jgi:hypothetical protein